MPVTDEKKLLELRKRIFLTAYSGGVGHLASAFSLVEILCALYLEKKLKYDPTNPAWAERDFMVLSKGHGSLALYNVLCEAGYFPEKKLYTFCQPGSTLGGEPHVLDTPGVEASTGSLGHGLSIGIGMALALKTDKKDNKVYVIVGDGECEEGSIWEAVMSATAFSLDNLTVIVDNNCLQKMGFIKDIMGIESWIGRFESFGWQAKTADGHDIGDLCNKLIGEWDAGKPHILIAQTVKGKGVSIMENNPSWHWKMPNKRELKVFMKELNISDEELESCRKRI
jgi:transketolase